MGMGVVPEQLDIENLGNKIDMLIPQLLPSSQGETYGRFATITGDWWGRELQDGDGGGGGKIRVMSIYGCSGKTAVPEYSNSGNKTHKTSFHVGNKDPTRATTCAVNFTTWDCHFLVLKKGTYIDSKNIVS